MSTTSSIDEMKILPSPFTPVLATPVIADIIALQLKPLSVMNSKQKMKDFEKIVAITELYDGSQKSQVECEK